MLFIVFLFPYIFTKTTCHSITVTKIKICTKWWNGHIFTVATSNGVYRILRILLGAIFDSLEVERWNASVFLLQIENSPMLIHQGITFAFWKILLHTLNGPKWVLFCKWKYHWSMNSKVRSLIPIKLWNTVYVKRICFARTTSSSKLTADKKTIIKSN